MSKNLKIVEGLFKKRKLLTDLELQGLTTLNPNSIRPCRLSLLRNGSIRKTSLKRAGYTVYEYVKGYSKKPTKQYSKKQIIDSLRDYKNKLKQVIDNIKSMIVDLS